MYDLYASIYVHITYMLCGAGTEAALCICSSQRFSAEQDCSALYWNLLLFWLLIKAFVILLGAAQLCIGILCCFGC